MLTVSTAWGQTVPSGIRGRVIDRLTRSPVAGAHVFVLGHDRADTSDSRGGFQQPLGSGLYLVQIRSFGYQLATWEVEVPDQGVLTWDFELEPVAATLPPVHVEAERDDYFYRGFEDRRGKGRGQFITHAEVARRNSASLGDLLRTLNGLRMHCTRLGCRIRMTRFAESCVPDYFMDGFPTNTGTAEYMPVTDIYGVEVYSLSEVPIEFQRPDLSCGVIAIWTRRGPPPR